MPYCVQRLSYIRYDGTNAAEIAAYVNGQMGLLQPYVVVSEGGGACLLDTEDPYSFGPFAFVTGDVALGAYAMPAALFDQWYEPLTP